MTCWQYLKINLADLSLGTDEVTVLNAAGAQRWELMSIASNNVAYLRRPLDEPGQATEAPQVARVSRRRAAQPDPGTA
jgi:hypothetical protein